jgi:hypothetical protein
MRTLAQIGLDPFGVAEIVDALARLGISGDKRGVGVSQGYKLTGTIKLTEVKLSNGNLFHARTPLSPGVYPMPKSSLGAQCDFYHQGGEGAELMGNTEVSISMSGHRRSSYFGGSTNIPTAPRTHRFVFRHGARHTVRQITF